MKRKNNLFARTAMVLLLAVLCSTGAWAQHEEPAYNPVIIILLNDGSKTEVLFDEMPEFTLDNGVMTLKGEKTELSWPLENLNKFTFSNVSTGIRNVKATDLDILSDGCVAYDLNGRVVRQNLKSLSELPKGVYLIKNGNVTTKVVRK
ncbi:MAG: T9SS type A sorting domain-containing protein [Prevotella sp.]|nr:T9SS type A sorting domain-containing protein [Prevotella sp.]